MPKRSTAWKAAEKGFACVLQKHGIPAVRLSRGNDFSKVDCEVHIEGQPWFAGDSKYTAAQRWRHHGLLEEIAYKYCKKPGYEPVLYTKQYRQVGGYVTVRDDFFAKLLKAYLDQKDKTDE